MVAPLDFREPLVREWECWVAVAVAIVTLVIVVGARRMAGVMLLLARVLNAFDAKLVGSGPIEICSVANRLDR